LSVLKPGGHFLAKTFQGGAENELLSMLKRNFRSVHHVKPPASRDESVELYLLAKDFKGREPPRGELEHPLDVPKDLSARSDSVEIRQRQ
ncbi:MAG: 23S rRNA methyltransferase, partial [Mesorhizobium sp.]